MADSTSIEISMTTQHDEKQTRNIGYINPNATPAQMRALAEGLVGLTVNTFNGVTLVEKTALVNKITPTITPDIPSVSFSQLKTQKYEMIRLEGSSVETEAQLGIPFIKSNNTFVATQLFWDAQSTQDLHNSGPMIALAYVEDWDEDTTSKTSDRSQFLGTTGTIVITFPETEIYNEVNVTITITN